MTTSGNGFEKPLFTFEGLPSITKGRKESH